jgi:hypothetical protein
MLNGDLKSNRSQSAKLSITTIRRRRKLQFLILEKIKAMDGVKDVVWSVIVTVVGRKNSIPRSIIGGILHETFTKGNNT